MAERYLEMTIVLQGEAASRLKEGMSVGNSIELAYFTPKFWVINGDARLKQVGGAQYFGGFAVSKEDWQMACDEWGFEPFALNGFVETDLNTADGKSIEVFSGRSLLVAPVASRVTWFTQDGTRTNEYIKGSRQHVQVIAYLAMKVDELVGETTQTRYEPLGPIMLTAKGFQAKNLLDSFAAWDRASKQVRGKIAPGVPAWCFYLALGTFGEKRNQVLVGKGSQSPITPINAYIPKEITGQMMEKLFVGQDVANAMVTYLDGAEEWLHAYDNATPKESGGHNGGTPPMPDFPEDELPPMPDDGLPF